MPFALVLACALLLARPPIGEERTIGSDYGAILTFDGPEMKATNKGTYHYHSGLDGDLGAILVIVTVGHKYQSGETRVGEDGQTITDLGEYLAKNTKLYPRTWERETIIGSESGTGTRRYTLARGTDGRAAFYWVNVPGVQGQGLDLSIFMFATPSAANDRKMLEIVRSIRLPQSGGDRPFANWQGKSYSADFAGVRWNTTTPIFRDAASVIVWPMDGIKMTGYAIPLAGSAGTGTDALNEEMRSAEGDAKSYTETVGGKAEFVRFLGQPFVMCATDKGVVLTRREQTRRLLVFLQGAGGGVAMLERLGKLERLGTDPKPLGDFFGLDAAPEWNRDISIGTDPRVHLWSPNPLTFEGSAANDKWYPEDDGGAVYFSASLRIDFNSWDFDAATAKKVLFDPKTNMPNALWYATGYDQDKKYSSYRTVVWRWSERDGRLILHSRVVAGIENFKSTVKLAWTVTDFVQTSSPKPVILRLTGNRSLQYGEAAQKTLASLQMPDKENVYRNVLPPETLTSMFTWRLKEAGVELPLPDCPSYGLIDEETKVYRLLKQRVPIYAWSGMLSFQAVRIPGVKGKPEEMAAKMVNGRVLRGGSGKLANGRPVGYALGDNAALVMIIGGRDPWELVWEWRPLAAPLADRYVTEGVLPALKDRKGGN